MFDGLIGVKDSGEALDLFFDGQDEPFTIAKHGNDALVAQLMPYVVPEDAQQLNVGGFPQNSTDEQRAAALEFAERDRREAELAAEAAGGPLMIQANDPMVARQIPEDLPIQSPIIAPELVPSFGGALQTGLAAVDAVPEAPVGFTPMDMTAAPTAMVEQPEIAPAGPRTLDPTRVKGATVTPAAPETAPDGRTAGGSIAQKFAMSSRGGGKGVDTNVRPMPAQDNALLDEQVKTALMMGDLKAEAELAKAKVLENAEIERATVDAQWKDRLAQNERAIQELDSDIRNGKVDPNRLWASMDGARQATTMIGLVLGGLAQGASGFRTENMALQTLSRMIDRDIAAQQDALGRKESLLQAHMQQGRDLRSARQMTKADMQVSLAAQLEAQAARSGSQQQQTAAQQASQKLRQEAQAAQAAAEGAWRDDEFKRIDVQSQAQLRASQANALRIETALKVAEANRAPGGGEPGKNPPMEIAPGVIVQPADATSRQNLEKAVDAFNTMRNLIVEARAHRAKAGAQLIPRTADYVKANRLEKQLITALNNVENLGAFDKGTADLLGQIVPSVGGVYTPGVVDSSLADLLDLAERKFKTKVMTNVVPGTGLVSFTGAQSEFKPVGKAD